MRTIFSLLMLAAVAWPQGKAPASETIRQQELEADLHFLASDAMRGRLTGSREAQLTAAWIESRFHKLGLKSAGRSGLTQVFGLTKSTLEADNRLTIERDGNAWSAKLLEDFYPLFFSGRGRSSGAVLFRGYGIDAPELGWRDGTERTVSGHVALILTGEPGANDPKSVFDGVVTSVHSDPLRKALTAQRYGAAAVFFVNPSGGRFAPAARSYWPSAVKACAISKMISPLCGLSTIACWQLRTVSS